jgi:hypothetical protein
MRSFMIEDMLRKNLRSTLHAATLTMTSMKAAMKILAVATTTTVLLTACQHPTRAEYDANHGWIVYGNYTPTIRGETPEVTPETAAAHADSGQLVVLSGTVSDVCRTMGCWIEIEDTNAEGARSTILVMNRDHAYFVPRNCRGRRVHAIGYVVVETHSVEMLKHLAMDAGKSQAEIDAITEPSKRVLFIANAILLPPGGLEKPVEPLPAEQEIPSTPDTSMTPKAETTTTPKADANTTPKAETTTTPKAEGASAPAAEPASEPAAEPAPASGEPPVDIPERAR